MFILHQSISFTNIILANKYEIIHALNLLNTQCTKSKFSQMSFKICSHMNSHFMMLVYHERRPITQKSFHLIQVIAF